MPTEQEHRRAERLAAEYAIWVRWLSDTVAFREVVVAAGDALDDMGVPELVILAALQLQREETEETSE